MENLDFPESQNSKNRIFKKHKNATILNALKMRHSF